MSQAPPNLRTPLNKSKFNQYFDTNLETNKVTIDKHLAKADIVSMDMREIKSLQHRQKVENYVKTKSLLEQSKVIFIY